MEHLVLTLIAEDRPGLVEKVARVVNSHGGNWLESRMASLAGKFAGILEIELSPAQREPMLGALRALEVDGLRILVDTAGAAQGPHDGQSLVLELDGQDQPGIVQDIAALLATRGVNVSDMSTERNNAPMSGGDVFSARFEVTLPAGLDRDALHHDLEQLANDIFVTLRVADAD